MKKLIFAFVVVSISTLAITNQANAQTSNKIKIFEPAVNVVTTISNKVLNNFKRNYKEASDVKWLQNDNTITAQFRLNEIYMVVYYDAKGHWQGSLKNYHEDKFDRRVRDIVKSRYYDYRINWVQEIETIDTYGVPTYLIYIEDDSNYKVIRVCDGVMDIFEQYKKQEFVTVKMHSM